MTVRTSPRGADAISVLVCKALAGGQMGDADALAVGRYGLSSSPALILRTAVSGIESDDFDSAFKTAVAEVFELVTEQLLLTRIPGTRRIGFFNPLLSITNGAVAAFIGEGKAIPLSRATFDPNLLTPKKCAGIVPATKEALRAGGPLFEAQLRNDLVRAIVDKVNGMLIDVTNAGDAATPESITHDGEVIVSSTSLSPAIDLRSMAEAFTGDLTQSAFVTDPLTALQLSLLSDGGGPLFPEVGIGGGMLAGLPLLVTRGSPRDTGGGQICLLDGTAIGFELGEIELTTTERASLEMSTAPTGDATTPAAATSTIVNLFQIDGMAIKAVLTVNWKKLRAGGVVTLTQTNYNDQLTG